MAEEYRSPESRFRMPSLFDFVGKTIGGYLLSESGFTEAGQEDLTTDPEAYDLFSKYTPQPYVKSGESQLTKSLFGMSQDKVGNIDRVFDISREGDADIFNISTGPAGQKYQIALDRSLHGILSLYSNSYNSILESGDIKDAEKLLDSARKKFMFKNPDTGELSYKFREGVLGDVYLNPKGEFSDYWNIGLDKGEELGYGKNLKRAMVAPFTKPPTVRGSVSMDARMKSFFEKLFEDPNKSTEGMLIDNMKDKSIF